MSKQKKVMVTPRKIEEIKIEAIGQTYLLVAVYLMDELDYSEDKIIEIWDGITRYASAVKDKDISMRKICAILEEHTGLKVRWNG